MGASASTVSNLPPLPPGAVLNSAPPDAAGLPPLPPGAKLAAPASATPPVTNAPAQQPQQDLYSTMAGSPEQRIRSAVDAASEAVGPKAFENTLAGVGHGILSSVSGLATILNTDRPSYDPAAADQYRKAHPEATPEQALQATMRPADLEGHIHAVKRATDWINNHNPEAEGFWQHVGDFGETVGELLTPDALGTLAKGAEAAKAGSAIAKTGEVMTQAEKLEQAGQVAKVLQRYPRIRALVALGLHTAARGGAEVGAQTYIKTGGDAEAAKHAAETAALVGGVGAPTLSAAGEVGAAAARRMTPEVREIEGQQVVVPKTKPLSGQQAAAREGYTATAKAAVRPHLEAMGATSRQADQVLNTVHDFTGAKDALEKVNNKAYDALDQVTGGKFRQLNSEVQAAQRAAWDGGPEAQAAYRNKQAEMEDLLNKSGVPKDLLGTVKASWRQSYVLGDMGKALDKSIDGIPGDTQVSQAQRGINGNKLQSGLRQIVNRYGRETVANSLGGEQRLDNLQAIADATKTNKGRQSFNYGVRRIAEWLPAYLGYKVGEHVGGPVAGVAGAGAAEATMVATKRVMNAVLTNPRIGQSLTFAIESGARPEKYGPMIGAMITQAESDREARKADAEAGR